MAMMVVVREVEESMMEYVCERMTICADGGVVMIESDVVYDVLRIYQELKITCSLEMMYIWMEYFVMVDQGQDCLSEAERRFGDATFF